MQDGSAEVQVLKLDLFFTIRTNVVCSYSYVIAGGLSANFSNVMHVQSKNEPSYHNVMFMISDVLL